MKKIPTTIRATRWHEADIGHSVTGHGGKCAHLHGHRYRFEFAIEANNYLLDTLGMVLDFGVIKTTLCNWIDANWDHKMVLWHEDPRCATLRKMDPISIWIATFNPTAENMADFLMHKAAELLPKGYSLVECKVHETLKCSATATLGISIDPRGAEKAAEKVDRLVEQMPYAPPPTQATPPRGKLPGGEPEVDVSAVIAAHKRTLRPEIKLTETPVGEELEAFSTEWKVGERLVPAREVKKPEQPAAEENAAKGLPFMEGNISAILSLIEPKTHQRAGLMETPARVRKAWEELTCGYAVDIPSLFKVFKDGTDNYDEMVVVKDIPFYSTCEHHLLPFFGTATVAYIPRSGSIVGLSKANRLVDAFARRLQTQERITAQVVDALMEHLEPLGAAVFLNARHMCMESRGVKQHGHSTTTVALRGVFKDKPDTRAEFMALVTK